MTFGEYDYETDIRVQRQEAKEEGIAQGLAQGITQGKEQGIAQGLAQGKEEGAINKTISFVRKAVTAGKLSLEEIAEYCELPLKRVKEIANEVIVAE